MSDEDRIAALEAKVAELEKKMADRSDDKAILAAVRSKLVEWTKYAQRYGDL